jgi:uncharacterized repeat protein (TIGR03943 family)
MRTRKWLQSILLLLLGLYFLENMLTGRIYLYINERFGWLSWIAAAIFLTLGVVGMMDLRRPPVEAHDHADSDHDDLDHEAHDHAGHHHDAAPSWPILGLVALPLVLGLLVPAKPLGASAVGTSGVSTSFSGIQGSGSATQLDVAPTARNVLDWVRVFNSSASLDDVSGQPADVIGFVYRDIRFKDASQFMVARFAISCCVADASAIGVIAQWPQAATLAQDSWVHVKGKFAIQTLDGQRTPILVVDSLEPTNQPEHPYLYP